MKSIMSKLILAFVSISLISVILILFVAQWTTEREFRSFLGNQTRESLVTTFSDYYQKVGAWTGVQNITIRQTVPPPDRPQDGQPYPFSVLDTRGTIVLAGPGYQLGDQVPQSVIDQGITITVNGKTVGYLINDRMTPRINPSGSNFLIRMNRIFWYSAIGAALVAIILGFLVSRSITRPIRELTDATRAVTAGDLEQQVPIRSKDEIGELAVSFNKMNAELAHSLDLRRQMTADIAHELRTPISVIIGYVDGIHDGVLEPTPDTIDIIREETGRLDHLVDDLRTLSKADAGELPLDTQRVDPRKLLQEAAAIHSHRAHQRNIVLTLDLAEDTPDVVLDYSRMMQVINNLLDNAMRYTPEGGAIRLSIAKVGEKVEIRVKDNGSGIAAEDLRRVFDRFYRSDPSRQHGDDSGSGLGLAIAKSIVERHGGDIHAESQPGEGTTMIIHLSAAETPKAD